MISLRNYVVGRIDQNERNLKKARESYQRTHDASWGARVAELQSVVDELKLVLKEINNKIEIHYLIRT